jgi:hypothetical protein
MLRAMMATACLCEKRARQSTLSRAALVATALHLSPVATSAYSWVTLLNRARGDKVRKNGRPREHANSAQKQQVYRWRKSESDMKGRHALMREEKLKAAIVAASCAGTLPFHICDKLQHGDEIDNLIDYLSSQQTLFTEL